MTWVKLTDRLARGNYLLHAQYYDMPITEYLNFLAFDLMKKKEREETLEKALNMAKSSKSPDVYLIAVVKEILNNL